MMYWLGRQWNRIKYIISLISEIKQQVVHFVKFYPIRNRYILSDKTRRTDKNKVNIHYWRSRDKKENLGDYLSEIVCNYCMEYWNLPSRLSEKQYRHLYAIGSIIGFSYQHAVVWGSGLLSNYKGYINVARISRLDIRCVRGPKTRDALLSVGIDCPDLYGDPAVLMPLIFHPEKNEKKFKVSVIRHYTDIDGIAEDQKNPMIHSIGIQTSDYKKVILEIVESERVISSSLHGIILAESYGVPAVYLRTGDTFKFEDYYLGTGRQEMEYVSSVQEGIKCKPMPLPDLRKMQFNLINAFPKDLWT